MSPQMGGVPLLKVLVGSRAHGLASDDSDYDYRAVFLHPTSRILSLGDKPNDTAWIEGTPTHEGSLKIDDTAWELGHFLNLATRCNPTILEVFVAPIVDATEDGERMRALLPTLWNPQAVRDAFVGYGMNQRKKMLDGKDARPAKYAVAFLRVLYQATMLLETGELPVVMTDTPVFDTLAKWKRGDYTMGEVVDVCREWEQRVQIAWPISRQKPNIAAVNDYLLDVRRRHW